MITRKKVDSDISHAISLLGHSIMHTVKVGRGRTRKRRKGGPSKAERLLQQDEALQRLKKSGEFEMWFR